MKRQLAEVDAILSTIDVPALDKQALQQIDSLYQSAEDLLVKKKRIDVALNAEPQILQRILRLFIRHEYYGSPEDDRPHFLVFVEGLVLDGTKSGAFPLSTFFERVSIQTQTEKKSSAGSQVLEWKEEDLAVDAHCFRAKVYSDKATSVRISLFRSNDVCPRYNISDQLRYLLPYLRVDPSEEEVLLAMWQYFEVNGLIGADRDRRYVKLTEPLKELFYGNKDYHSPSILISSLRTRLLPHLILARPLVVEHPLSPTNTPELVALSMKNNYSLTGGGRWPTSIAYARVGGRVFDVEVDVLDTACFDVLHTINRWTALEYDADDRIRVHLEKLAYLARRMQAIDQERQGLLAALSEFDAVISSATEAETEAENATKAAPRVVAVPSSSKAPPIPTVLESADAALIYERIRRRPAVERVEQPTRSYFPIGGAASGSGKGAGIGAAPSAIESKDGRDVKPEPGATSVGKPGLSGVPPRPLPAQAGVPQAPVAGGRPVPTLSGRPPMGTTTVGATGKAAVAAASTVRGEPLAVHCTSLHTLTGYVDVGDASLFGADQAWVRPACEKLIAGQQQQQQGLQVPAVKVEKQQ